MSVSVSGTVVAATDLALLVEVDGEQIWFPRSKCEYTNDAPMSHTDLEIPEWLAEKHGLS